MGVVRRAGEGECGESSWAQRPSLRGRGWGGHHAIHTPGPSSHIHAHIPPVLTLPVKYGRVRAHLEPVNETYLEIGPN